MGWPQIVTGTALTLGLLVLALFFGWQQLHKLHHLARTPQLPGEETRFFKLQFFIRLATSILLLILGLMLGYGLVFLETRAQNLADFRDAGNALPDADKPFAEFYQAFWLIFLLLLLLLMSVAAIDLLTIRRWGLRHQRQIAADRRAMLERQLRQLQEDKRDQNGHLDEV